MDAIAQITKPSLGGRAKVLLDGLPVGRGVGLSGDRDPVSLGRLEEGDVDVRVLLDLLVLVARVVVDEDGLELVSGSGSHGSRVLRRHGGHQVSIGYDDAYSEIRLLPTKDPSTPTVVKLQVPTFFMMASTSATRSCKEGVWSSDFLEYLSDRKVGGSSQSDATGYIG